MHQQHALNDCLQNCLQGLELKRHVDVTLGRGKIYDAVKLPEGEDVREWLAVNTVDMYNAVSVLYMTLIDICTDTTCPTMTAGAKVSSVPSPCLERPCARQHCQ